MVGACEGLVQAGPVHECSQSPVDSSNALCFS
jgi:hypothetical protein